MTQHIRETSAIAAITLAELLAGVERLPDGQRKTGLSQAIADAIAPYQGSRSILPFSEAAAPKYAEILYKRERAGVPISTADALIAAICLLNRATLATRNTKDFVFTGVDIVTPWGEP